MSHGIQVVVIDSKLNGDFHASFIESDNYRAGQQAADCAGRLLPAGGTVSLLRYSPNHASTTDRERGFMVRLASRYPHITVLADPFAGTTVGSAYHTALNMVDRKTDLDAIFAVNESTTMGALLMLQESGLQDTIKLIGFDVNHRIEAALLQGKLHATIIQQPYDMGYQGVKSAVDLIGGRDVPQKILTPTFLIDAANYHADDVQALLHKNRIDSN